MQYKLIFFTKIYHYIKWRSHDFNLVGACLALKKSIAKKKGITKKIITKRDVQKQYKLQNYYSGAHILKRLYDMFLMCLLKYYS